MTPFQYFRLWARRAPLVEKTVAVTACLLVVVVVGWLVSLGVPSAKVSASAGTGSAGGAQDQSASGVRDGSSAVVTGNAGEISASARTQSGGAASGTPSLAGTPGSGPGGANGGSVAGAGARPRSATSSGSCAAPAGTVPGVTAKQIKIAVTLTEIIGPAANSTFGLPSVSAQQAYYQDVIDSINAAGGVDCRQLVPEFYPVNAADQSNQEQNCLDIAQAGVFAELDFTAYSTVGGDCFAQHHVPFFIDYFLTAQATNQFYPYLFGLNTYESLYHNAILALNERKFFDSSNGFKKLGFIYRDCFPQVPTEVLGSLRQVGVPSSDIVTYDVGCPAAFASPSDLEQAVLKFQEAGVTNVTTGYFLGDFSNFTTVAEQQGFRPKYGIGDDGTVNISYGSQHPDYANIAGAIAITASRYGEERTSGMSPTSGTVRCNGIYASRGEPPVYQQPIGAGGDVCDQLWMFTAAVEHAPVLSPAALGAGLQAAGSVDFSYPQGPNSFRGDRATTGGEYWRTDEFFTSCDCWRVIDPSFHPSFN